MRAALQLYIERARKVRTTKRRRGSR
ncbi:MAG: hypothetical protein AB7P47_22760 [Nocardioides sp.]